MYIGIDVGGTSIKAALMNNKEKVLSTASLPTDAQGGWEAVLKNIIQAAKKAADKDIEINAVCAAIPGIVAGEKGPVVFAPNIGLKDADIVPELEGAFSAPAILANDAACAAVAESRLGAGKKYKNIVMLTLGTAVGGAVVFGGKLFNGFGKFGGEICHIPLAHGGTPCSCGVAGCFEQCGSAPALVRLARGEMKRDSSSRLWRMEGSLTAEDVFEAAELGDFAAKTAADRYETYVAEGIAGLVNIFRPDAVIIGGGISAAGEPLLAALNEKLSCRTYASEFIPAPPVIAAKLGGMAGAIGAALLASEAGGRDEF